MNPQKDNIKKEKKKKNGKRLFFRILIIVVLALFIGATAYSVNARRLVRNSTPMPFGWGASVVLSGSMEPTLSVNDLVILRATGDYKVGDVVVYQSGASRVIHRIIRIDGESVVTQGDANNTADEPILMKDIKGEMMGKVPFVGAVIRFLQTPIGIILVVVGLILLINLSWKREKKEDDGELDEIKEEIRRLKALEEERLNSAAAEKADAEDVSAPAEEPDKPELQKEETEE